MVKGSSLAISSSPKSGRNTVFYVLEINTVPGMTSHSCVPKSGSFLGMEYKEVVQKIIDASL